MSWRTTKFGEFADVQPSIQLDRGMEYPFIPMEIVEPHRRDVPQTETRVWDGGGGARFQSGDTIFARITPCLEHGKTAQVRGLEKEVGFGSTEFLVFRGRPRISDSNFIYYLACSDVIREPAIKSMVGASGRQRAQRRVIEGILVRVPSEVEVQQEIADVLSAYDELLENNRRRMGLLEEAARLLYREWFVRLRFPGHEHARITNGIPEGWERKPLGERATLNYGKALKAEERIDGPFPVYGSSGIVGSHEKPLTNGPGIILGRKGNVGSVFWSSKDFYAIDTVYFVDAQTSNLYLFYALKDMHFISTDVAVPGLNRDFAYSRPLVIPAKLVFRQFLEAVSPMHEQMEKLDEMNQKLRAARDLLLPRLMSGEISV
jgi:type I restriction enzyme S subunit